MSNRDTAPVCIGGLYLGSSTTTAAHGGSRSRSPSSWPRRSAGSTRGWRGASDCASSGWCRSRRLRLTRTALSPLGHCAVELPKSPAILGASGKARSSASRGSSARTTSGPPRSTRPARRAAAGRLARNEYCVLCDRAGVLIPRAQLRPSSGCCASRSPGRMRWPEGSVASRAPSEGEAPWITHRDRAQSPAAPPIAWSTSGPAGPAQWTWPSTSTAGSRP